MRHRRSPRSGRRLRAALLGSSLLAGVVCSVPVPVGAADGDLDAGFVGGIVTAAFGPSADIGTDVLVQPDGKVVVSGWSPNFDVGQPPGPGAAIRMGLARFNRDGTPDTGFGTAGKAIATVGTDLRALSIGRQPDGKIIAVGVADGTHVGIVRFTASGVIDPSFGSAGALNIPLATSFSFGEAVAVQPDGKILVAGEAVNGSGQNLSFSFFVMRFDPTGIFDPTFGTNGIVSTPAPGAEVTGMVLRPDGKIVLSGAKANPQNGSASVGAVLRYNADGTLDTTFGGTGIVTAGPAANSTTFAGLAVHGDGSVVAAGNTASGSLRDVFVARFTAAGTLDPSFDGDGVATTPLASGSSLVADVVLQPDERIVVAASAGVSPGADIALLRYDADGRLDPTFGTAGIVRLGVPSRDPSVEAMAIAPDGSLVVGGTLSIDSTHAVVLAARFVDRYARLTPVSPVRVLDTRAGARPAAGTIVRVPTGAPAGTSAVLANLTVTGAQAPGYITADRCSALSAGPQEKSNANYQAGQDVANTAVVNVDADGSFCIYTDQSAHLLVDLQGTYADDGLRLTTVAPVRVLNTRSGARPGAGTIVRVTTGAPAGTSAVLMNLTVTAAEAAGYVTADRCSVLVAGPQEKSNLNYRAGEDVANTAVVNVDADGSFCIYTDRSAHLLADLQGTYQAASGRELATFTPRRVLDTRSSGRVAAGSITKVTTNVATGATSVLVNLTVTGAQAAGFVTADRCSVLVAGPQEKSNVNYRAGADVANTAVVNVDADGSFCIYTDQATHLLVDVQGVHVG